MRKRYSQNIDSLSNTKECLINYSNEKDVYFIIDSNSNIRKNEDIYKKYDFIAAFGIKKQIECKSPSKSGFSDLNIFYKENKDWIFGYLSYDLKNEIENLSSNNIDNLDFSNLYFIIPEIVICLSENKLSVEFFDDDFSISEIKNLVNNILTNQESTKPINSKVNITARFSKEEYLETIKKIKHHIQIGDVYELNLCQEFYSENTEIDTIDVYKRLTQVSPTPFSCYVKQNNNYIICASPERFLTKNGTTIISQPIKGTKPRGKDKADDLKLIDDLEKDPKERAENIMITDLVRNDLSHFAKKGSVRVPELCKIYTFPTVHQMISTISAELENEELYIKTIKKAFPMGSMTGAPKIKSMELIEKYEKTKRGVFSGSVGYIDPHGNSDFNVIIRTILYNKKNKYLSFCVGGAITINSIPENEYQECLVKASAITKVLKDLKL